MVGRSESTNRFAPLNRTHLPRHPPLTNKELQLHCHLVQLDNGVLLADVQPL
ncbi:hypothetical protein BLSMQ_3527 [Brevibacterium aurantiacum]|uniref:Uncharacterized protein n=1 Tax=Brevibacterium aurantiacum TaxID=273384 RepID=A0A1D7W851_BREAU|nr:hypothetical protein BLSMQ_3527 [Brevibacterium aurantiacum]